ncbi:MAG: hypothetical protein E7529_05715 [Ruminococcaceae bacterium]|nr:hypothetical protein [Oscillospiraceae bacterium]
MALIDKLNAIGDAVREKNGTTELIPLADIPQAILAIAGGGNQPLPMITINADSCAFETIIANASGTATVNSITIQADALASLEE